MRGAGRVGSHGHTSAHNPSKFGVGIHIVLQVQCKLDTSLTYAASWIQVGIIDTSTFHISHIAQADLTPGPLSDVPITRIHVTNVYTSYAHPVSHVQCHVSRVQYSVSPGAPITRFFLGTRVFHTFPSEQYGGRSKSFRTSGLRYQTYLEHPNIYAGR